MLTNQPLVDVLWSAQLLSVVRVLSDSRDFFELDASARTERGRALSVSLQEYLIAASEKSFLDDSAGLFSGHLGNNIFAQKLTQYLVNDFAPVLDRLPAGFGGLSSEEKVEVLKALKLSDAENQVLANFSLHQIELSIDSMLRATLLPVDSIVVETPRLLGSEQKNQMRGNFKNALVSFHVTPSLLGGIRILKNDLVCDYSWNKKINALSKQLPVF